MPVEIKELLVKGILEGAEDTGKKPSSNTVKEKDQGNGGMSYSQKKQIIDQCVQEVMDKIKKMNEF